MWKLRLIKWRIDKNDANEHAKDLDASNLQSEQQNWINCWPYFSAVSYNALHASAPMLQKFCLAVRPSVHPSFIHEMSNGWTDPNDFWNAGLGYPRTTLRCVVEGFTLRLTNEIIFPVTLFGFFSTPHVLTTLPTKLSARLRIYGE